MATLSITQFVTLDGVIQAPGGPDEDRSDGFAYGGWCSERTDDEVGRFMAEVFGKAEAFLLGRRTYEAFSAYWPKVTDPGHGVAGPLNRLPKYVASRTLKTVDWQNARITADAVTEAAALRARHQGEVQIHGSAGLAQSLMANNLIDVYRLVIHPIVLGSGKRLFADGVIPAAMTLTDSRTTKMGVTMLTLRRSGTPTYGELFG